MDQPEAGKTGALSTGMGAALMGVASGVVVTGLLGAGLATTGGLVTGAVAEVPAEARAFPAAENRLLPLITKLAPCSPGMRNCPSLSPYSVIPIQLLVSLTFEIAYLS